MAVSNIVARIKILTHECRIVCLCGSTKFVSDFETANLRETLAGNVVLSIGSHITGDDELQLTPDQKMLLDRLHLAKIDMSDEVLVINTGGYIGRSTREEILHAWKKGKPVRFEYGDPEIIEITLHNLWNWEKIVTTERNSGVHQPASSEYGPIFRQSKGPNESTYQGNGAYRLNDREDGSGSRQEEETTEGGPTRSWPEPSKSEPPHEPVNSRRSEQDQKRWVPAPTVPVPDTRNGSWDVPNGRYPQPTPERDFDDFSR